MRIYINEYLSLNQVLQLSQSNHNYLIKVMRLSTSDSVEVFNGNDGLWLAKINEATSKKSSIIIERQILKQPEENKTKVHCLFAPLKKTATMFLVEKAVELGVDSFTPIITQRVNMKISPSKIEEYIISATKQCERLSLPILHESISFGSFISKFKNDKVFVASEYKETKTLLDYQDIMKDRADIYVLIGPEGGFSPAEMETMKAQDNIYSFTLGKNILRAETAALATVVQIQTMLGNMSLSS